MADIINGPLDADKLDYLARDAKFSGISIQYDIDRYLMSVNISEDKNNYRRLSLPLSGVGSLEQIVMCKMILYSSLYHHHKIRCAENMLKNVCRNINKANGSLKLENPVDFLNCTDSDIIDFSNGLNSNPSDENTIYCGLSKRKLMKRALIISRPFIIGFNKSEDVADNYTQLLNDIDENIVELIDKICNEANKTIEIKGLNKIGPKDIIIDMPKEPSMEESRNTPIVTGYGLIYNDNDLEFDEIFPVGRWITGYSNIKLRGHVFCHSNIRHDVNIASRKVFARSPYNLKFSATATQLCKLRYDPLAEEETLIVTP